MPFGRIMLFLMLALGWRAFGQERAVDIYERAKRERDHADFDAALADFSKVIQLAPWYADAYLGRADIRDIKGDTNGALADYNKAVALNSKSAQAVFDRAEFKSDKDDWDGAIADYNRAIELESRWAYAYARRGHAKNKKHDLAGAASDYDRGVELDPRSVQPLLTRAKFREAITNTDGALADYNRAVELDTGALFSRAEFHYQQGDLNKALDDYNRVLELQSTNSYGFFKRGEVKNELNDLKGALADYTQSCKLDTNPPPSIALWPRSLLKEEMGDLDGALEDFRQIQKAYQAYSQNLLSDADIQVWIVQVRQGKKAAADRELTVAVEKRDDEQAYEIQRLDGTTLRFLLDQITESEFLAVKEPAKPRAAQIFRNATWYYAGLKRLLAGDKKTAAEDFRKCQPTGPVGLEVYRAARAELRRIESGKAEK